MVSQAGSPRLQSRCEPTDSSKRASAFWLHPSSSQRSGKWESFRGCSSFLFLFSLDCPMAEFQQAVFDAVAKGDETAVSQLLALGGSIHEADAEGQTALHWAAASRESENLVPFLLLQGARIDARDAAGRTPLHLHCALGRRFGTSCLLHQGADVNLQTTGALLTPLHLAAKFNHIEIASLLIAYGANLSITNAKGQLPRDLGLKSSESPCN